MLKALISPSQLPGRGLLGLYGAARNINLAEIESGKLIEDRVQPREAAEMSGS